MKRFAIATALAVVIGLGAAGTADAQYVQRYATVTPNGGLVIGNNYSNYGAYQTNRTYVSPYGIVKQQTQYGDVFGNTYGQSTGYNNYTGAGYNRNYGYNNFTGYGYNNTFYQPSPFAAPYGGYNNFYGYGRRY